MNNKSISLIIFLAVVLLVGSSVSAVTWTSATGCWTATDGIYSLVMWNATGTSTWTVPATVTNVTYLVVSGGGEGGGKDSSDGGSAGGGGAGGLLNGTALAVSGIETIVVGVGGSGSTTGVGVKGGNSSLTNDGATIEPNGGGGGARYASTAVTGGSSGGAGGNPTTSVNPSPADNSQGYIGGQAQSGSLASGGGGGAGGAGSNFIDQTSDYDDGGAGGVGKTIYITDTPTCYAGGGGGASYHAINSANGGAATCGGGAGGTGGAGSAATPATGGGGGGTTKTFGTGGDGGSGIVIVKYQTPSGGTLTANFVAAPLNATIGQSITFNDTSIATGGIASWASFWDFGDSTNSSVKNLTKSYSADGTYSVNLTVFNSTFGNSSQLRTGYININPSGSLSGLNQQDIVIDEVYTLALTFKDAASHATIPTVTATDSFNTTIITTVGMASFQYNYTTVAVFATSSGYYGASASYIMDRDRSETFYLTRDTATSGGNTSIPIANIYPHYVTFHIKEGWGTALPDVTVDALGVSTSTGSWDWIVTLIGIPLDEVPINGTVMTQTTDSLGTATFYMIPTGKYNITFTKTGYTIPSIVLVPQDDDYIIYASGADTSFYRNGQDELAAVSVSVVRSDVNASYSFLNLTYLDTTGHTTGGTIDVYQKSESPGGVSTTLAHWHITSSSFTQSVGVVHATQVSGYVSVNATHSDFGSVKRTYPFQLNSVPVDFLGFGDDIKLLVALGMMLFTVMLGGAAHGRQVMLVMAIEGVIFYTFHWFNALIARGVPETSIILGLLLMFVVSVLANFEQRKKREKY